MFNLISSTRSIYFRMYLSLHRDLTQKSPNSKGSLKLKLYLHTRIPLGCFHLSIQAIGKRVPSAPQPNDRYPHTYRHLNPNDTRHHDVKTRNHLLATDCKSPGPSSNVMEFCAALSTSHKSWQSHRNDGAVWPAVTFGSNKSSPGANIHRFTSFLFSRLVRFGLFFYPCSITKARHGTLHLLEMLLPCHGVLLRYWSRWESWWV